MYCLIPPETTKQNHKISRKKISFPAMQKQQNNSNLRSIFGSSMKKIITLIALGLFPILVFAGNEKYEQAWKALSENKFTEAKQLFEDQLKNEETKANAMLSLAYVHMALHQMPEARKYVSDFIKVSENPNPYLFACWSNGLLNSGTTEERIDFLQSLLKMPQINPTLKAMASESLANLYISKFEVDKAKKAGLVIGMIPDWSIVGCFENISSSGFNKEVEFGPLAHPESDYEFSNKAKTHDIFVHQGCA